MGEDVYIYGSSVGKVGVCGEVEGAGGVVAGYFVEIVSVGAEANELRFKLYLAEVESAGIVGYLALENSSGGCKRGVEGLYAD